jgi:alcohol dehydrogenase (NADP+)
MASDYKFQGWLGLDKSSAEGNMVWQEFEPKTFQENDVDIKVSHCGICGSDIHTLRSGWAPTVYPVCVGHEIVGEVVRVGSKVENGIKLGDRYVLTSLRS